MHTICVNTQSSPIRILVDHLSGQNNSTLNIDNLKESVDFDYNAGGVTRMIDPMIKYGIRSQQFSDFDWIALSSGKAFEIDMGDYLLYGIPLPEDVLRKYAAYKEAIWDKMHGRTAHFTRGGFKAYLEYNLRVSQKIIELNGKREYDMLYIHDFQQLPQGRMLGDFAPQIFRWHIPLYAKFCKGDMRNILLGYLRKYTSVIVSTERYEAELRNMGFKGHVIHSYPYVDDGALKRQPYHKVSEFREKWGISANDKVILCVARRTPSKNQNILIRAMKSLIRVFPDSKLILVGNGSFSNSPKGGLGLSKSEKWTQYLRSLISSLGLNDKVVITGYLNREEVQLAYEASDLLVLPSLYEGFGLVVIEAWFYQKPVLVSQEAGVAERVTEGENGYTFDPRKPRELADMIISILKNPAMAESMGRNGYDVAQEHTMRRGLESEVAIIQETIDLWQTRRDIGSLIDLAET